MTVICVLCLIFASSCEYAWIDHGDAMLPDTVSFKTHLVPLFEQGCNASVCHGGSADPDLRPDNAYNSLISGGYVDTDDPGQSSLYTSLLRGGSMEQYADPGDAELILRWIEQGAQNN